MMKTLSPVFRPPAAADEVDEADVDEAGVDDADVELEPEDEHAASRTDTMTRPLVSQAVCLSFISESFQSDRWGKPAGAARRRGGPRPPPAVWVTAECSPAGDPAMGRGSGGRAPGRPAPEATCRAGRKGTPHSGRR